MERSSRIKEFSTTKKNPDTKKNPGIWWYEGLNKELNKKLNTKAALIYHYKCITILAKFKAKSDHNLTHYFSPLEK